MKKVLIAATITLLALFSSQTFSMTITPMDNAANLAQAIVGPGVTISNVTYTGAKVASGYFSGGLAAGIGIQSGIVLTSGYASNLHGTSNTSGSITGDNGRVGYGLLNGLIPGYTTYDATVLAFDFVSIGSTAYFNYVFGSEEYNEWVGSSYNDVFGFFFGETNIALIPGTSTPVSINNVNLGKNAAYYNNNGAGIFPFEYDGFTKVFTASLTDLAPGETYHLILAIADAGDRVLDSGVFIQGGSFSDQPIEPEPIPEPGTMLLLGSGLVGLAGYARKRFRK